MAEESKPGSGLEGADAEGGGNAQLDDELDLSKIDSLLTDLEKDLPNIQSESSTDTRQPAGSATRISASASGVGRASSVGVSDADPTPAGSADTELPEIPHDEILGSPVRPTDKDDPPDDLEDMFTTETESLDTESIPPKDAVTPLLIESESDVEAQTPGVMPQATEGQVPNMTGMSDVRPQATEGQVPNMTGMSDVRPHDPQPAADVVAPTTSAPETPMEESVAKPAFEDALELEEEEPAPAEAAAKPDEKAQDISFEDLLELEGEDTPVRVQKPPMEAISAAVAKSADPAIPDPKATPENFHLALRDRQYQQAVRIGNAIFSKGSSISFRIDLAGAMFCSGRPDEAERELQAILDRSPYNISARRNLELVRSGAKPS